MIIKCPQCATGYNVPDEAITAKPRKMRCSRCANVFTLHRRADAAPAGYEEFTGKQNLPSEFAFLREAPAAAQPPLATPIVAAPPASAPAPAPAQAPAVPPPTQEGLYQRLAEQDGETVETIPLDPPMVSGPATPAAAAPPPPEPGPAARTPTPGPAPAPAAIGDIYGGSRSAWEMEAPLELAGFAIPDETTGSSSAQTAGKVMAVGLVLLAVFFTFVAFRNGWSLSLTDLPEQVSFAFSGAEYEAIPDEARSIEITVSEHHLVQADSGGQFLLVSGTVFNTALFPLRHVVLRGQLLDSNGEIRGETRAPCGKVLDDKTVQATAPGAIDGHYRQDGVLHDCQVRAEGTTVFQLIFPDVPVDYDSDFMVEAKAVAASSGN
jgi:predicted Zn finger-like uncharacterized protein